MTTTERVRLEEPRLFHEIDGLDDHILEDLANIDDENAIVICKIGLPADQLFGLEGEQYGIYIFLINSMGNRVIKGVRTERHEGQKGKTITLRAVKAVMSAFVSKEFRIVEFKYNTSSCW